MTMWLYMNTFVMNSDKNNYSVLRHRQNNIPPVSDMVINCQCHTVKKWITEIFNKISSANKTRVYNKGYTSKKNDIITNDSLTNKKITDKWWLIKIVKLSIVINISTNLPKSKNRDQSKCKFQNIKIIKLIKNFTNILNIIILFLVYFFLHGCCNFICHKQFKKVCSWQENWYLTT